MADVNAAQGAPAHLPSPANGLIPGVFPREGPSHNAPMPASHDEPSNFLQAPTRLPRRQFSSSREFAFSSGSLSHDTPNGSGTFRRPSFSPNTLQQPAQDGARRLSSIEALVSSLTTLSFFGKSKTETGTGSQEATRRPSRDGSVSPKPGRAAGVDKSSSSRNSEPVLRGEEALQRNEDWLRQKIAEHAEEAAKKAQGGYVASKAPSTKHSPLPATWVYRLEKMERQGDPLVFLTQSNGQAPQAVLSTADLFKNQPSSDDVLSSLGGGFLFSQSGPLPMNPREFAMTLTVPPLPTLSLSDPSGNTSGDLAELVTPLPADFGAIQPVELEVRKPLPIAIPATSPAAGSRRTSAIAGAFSSAGSSQHNLSETSPFQIENPATVEPVFTLVRESAHQKVISRLSKYNSCSTLNVLGTPCRSDLKVIVRLVSMAIHDMILEAHRSRRFRSHRIFSEEIYPLSKHNAISHPCIPPTLEGVYNFLFVLFDAAQLGSEITVIMLVYLDRMLMNGGLTMYSANWARMTLGALLLASKVWDDQAVWNVDFCTIFPDAKVKDINALEQFYIESMFFNVSVRGPLYAKYYFALHEKFGEIAAKPMRLHDAIRLEAVTCSSQQVLVKKSALPSSTFNLNLSSMSMISPFFGRFSACGTPCYSDGLAGPAMLPGVTPNGSSLLIQQSTTGVRRTRSDYVISACGIPASIM